MNIEELILKILKGAVGRAAIDSRLVQEGGIFFALKGQRSDGHLFLEEASKKKAIAAVVSKEYKGESFGLELIYVEDVLTALRQIAKKVAEKKSYRRIGITGSVGKTTTKEFVYTILKKRFSVGKNPGSYNSQATVPLNILNFSGQEGFFIQEMGMSQSGEIARLVEIAPPDIAFVGKIGLAHASSFPRGLEAIAEAKAEILSHSKTSLAVIHAKTLKFPAFQNLCIPVISYSGGDYQLEQVQAQWRIKEGAGASPLFELPLLAPHFRENFLGAAALARTLGMTWEEIIEQIPSLTSIERRFERIDREGIIFFNDAYNANPTSMKAALENLPPPQGGRKIAIIGEMQSLGIFSVAAHQEIGEFAAQHVDELLCFGPESLPAVEAFSKSGKLVRYFSCLDALKEALLQTVHPGDVVLIKGSNSKQMWKLLE